LAEKVTDLRQHMTLMNSPFGGVLKSMLTLNEAIIDVKES